MSENNGSESRDQTPAPQPKTIRDLVLDQILVTAHKAAAELAALGISTDKINSAAKVYAATRAEKIVVQAETYAVKLGKTEVVTATQILDQIARQSGIKLDTRKPPVRKPHPKNGEKG